MKHDWSSIIQQYPAAQHYTYLNTPSCGLISQDSSQLAHTFYDDFLDHGGQKRADWYPAVTLVKESLADILNIQETAEIAIIPNFSVGMNFMVRMLRPLDKVLLLDQDYPSLTMPWLLHDYQMCYQAWEKNGCLNLDRTASLIKEEGIKILAISHVQYHTGYCADLKALGKICHEHGALLLLDATQSVGAVPIDVQDMGIDILLASGYKWLTAGFGNGFLYLRKELLDEFYPSVIGNNSFDGFPDIRDAADIPSSIRNFEAGHFDFSSILVMEQALKNIRSLGVDAIHQRNLQLTHYAMAALGEHLIFHYPSENQSSIQLISGDEKLFHKLNEHKITATMRGKGVRVGMHFYNQEEDIDRLKEVMLHI